MVTFRGASINRPSRGSNFRSKALVTFSCECHNLWRVSRDLPESSRDYSGKLRDSRTVIVPFSTSVLFDPGCSRDPSGVPTTFRGMSRSFRKYSQPFREFRDRSRNIVTVGSLTTFPGNILISRYNSRDPLGEVVYSRVVIVPCPTIIVVLPCV